MLSLPANLLVYRKLRPLYVQILDYEVKTKKAVNISKHYLRTPPGEQWAGAAYS